MRFALRFVELRLQNLTREFHITVVSRMLGISERGSERAAILAEHFFIGRSRIRLVTANHVGHQRPVIAQVELCPFRLLWQIDRFQRAVFIA